MKLPVRRLPWAMILPVVVAAVPAIVNVPPSPKTQVAGPSLRLLPVVNVILQWRFLREVRQAWGVRLGRAGRGRQVLLEDLARGAVAEAAPRGVVEPVGEPAEAGAGERLGRALARQEASGAAVQVLDAALLPGGVRVAEVAGHV